MTAPAPASTRFLEDEAITIIREVAAEFERPVLLFSGGKDSVVMLHLALRAFAPARVPFPIMHVDTGHNFPELIEFRDRTVERYGVELIVASVQESIDRGRVREDTGPRASRNPLQTVTLLDAIAEHRFDAVFGGARRDEERARAKERIFSLRNAFGQWDPKNQRPELWDLYNSRVDPGESIRVFPLSNWTELDVWHYIHLENIPVVPMYLAAPRQVVARDELLIPVIDPSRLPPDAHVETVVCRFRTLGCWPCTGAIRSEARTVREIIQEMMTVRNSERITRIIDHDQDSSMEQKKREGYF